MQPDRKREIEIGLKQKIDELMAALKYSGGLTGLQPELDGVAALRSGSTEPCCAPAPH